MAATSPPGSATAFNETADQLEARLEELAPNGRRPRHRDRPLRRRSRGDSRRRRAAARARRAVVETTGATGGLVVASAARSSGVGDALRSRRRVRASTDRRPAQLRDAYVLGCGFTVEQRRMAARSGPRCDRAREREAARVRRAPGSRRHAHLFWLIGATARRRSRASCCAPSASVARLCSCSPTSTLQIDQRRLRPPGRRRRAGRVRGDTAPVVREIDVRRAGAGGVLHRPAWHRPRRRGPPGRAHAPPWKSARSSRRMARAST